MKPRNFLVDITISLPNGSNAKDWHYVGHLFVDLNEAMLDIDPLKMASRVVQEIDKFIDKHPKAHNCMDNVVQDDGGEYFCEECNEEVTPEVEKLLTLSAERSLNGKATDIVLPS